MSFFKKLFGSRAEPGLFGGSPRVVPAHSHASATWNMPEAQGQDYFNKDWNFGVTIPKGWRVIFENESGNPWMQPLRIAGPKVSRGQPFLSVLVAVVQNASDRTFRFSSESSIACRWYCNVCGKCLGRYDMYGGGTLSAGRST